MKRLVFTIAILLGLAAPAWAGFDEGVAAYKRGDYATALREFLPLAEQGNAGAQHSLGLMYNNGQGVPQDHTEAAKWYRKAAEQGIALAQGKIGFMYLVGQGVPLDFAEALKWFRIAQTRRGGSFGLGDQRVPQDYAEAVKLAVKLFRKAAKQGDADARFQLGVMYYEGLGVPQDYAEAEKWYRKAAFQGYANAQYILGNMYRKGQGVPQDYAEAVKWFRMAAEQGMALAQGKIGLMYAKGQGVPQDYVLAHMWISVFAAQRVMRRDTTAKTLDFFASEMTPAQITEAQRLAREWKPKKEGK